MISKILRLLYKYKQTKFITTKSFQNIQMNQINQMNFLQPFNYCIYPYRNPYYYNLYADNMHEQNSSTATYKSEVIQWLTTLEQSELYKLFQIKGQIKTFPIMKMFIYDKLNNPSNYALLQKATINLESKIDDQFMVNFKALHPKAEELYSKLNIVDDENFLDTIFVAEPHLENLNSFLDLLHDLSDKYFLSTSPKPQIEIAEDPFWFHKNSFHSCAVWIIKEFEKNISFHFSLHREKKKKQRLFKEPIYQNTSNELKEFFLQNLANNKEKLTFYFQEIYSEIKQQSDLLENKFYENIFSGTAIKLMKSQVELLLNFQQKCHTDTNIINSMLISSMNDLVDQKTYILKKFYKIVQHLFQEHLEQELFKTEMQDKKLKKDKKKKKKKYQKIQTFKGLDPIELNKRLSSKNLQESNILRFSRSHSQSNLAYTYVTPPNTPSTWETSDDQQECIKASNIQQLYKNQFIQNQRIYLIQAEQQSISEQFIAHYEIPTNDDYVDVGQAITINILEMANNSLNDENQFREQFLKEKKRIKKKQKGFQKSIPESRDEQLQLQSPQSEITRFSIETQAQTIKSHCSNRTSSTSEEEEEKQKLIQIKNQIKIKKNNNEKQNNLFKLINSLKMNQFEDQQFQQDINSVSNESEQVSQKHLEDEIDLKTQKKNQQFQKKKNETIQQNLDKNQKDQLENVQQKGKQKLIEQINLDILDFTDNIMNEYEDMLPFRFLSFDRVKLVIQKVFLGIPDGMIMLFGSCSTGLALIDSDIDIGINGLEVYNRNMLKNHFDNLFFEFSRKKWVIKANPIFNSSVPIIKLELDPQINVFDYEGRNLDENQIQQWKKLKQKLKSGIKVDISFNFNGNGIYSTHLGSITTDLVKRWMEEYPSLQQIVLILKSMIKKLKLSESYTGGLSSYSLIIMVYSYLRENRITSNQIGEQFIDLINFYVNYFDSSSTGIGLLSDINNPNSSYFFNLQDYCLPMLPITIFNPYNRKLLTHSCVQINKIFDFFKIILKEVDTKKEFYYNYVVLGKKKQQKLNKQLSNFIVSILEQIK